MLLTFFIALVALVLIGAIVWLNRPTTGIKERTREDYLRELAKYFEGTLSAVEGKEDSYRIEFDFEKEHFVLEDFREASFGQGKFKAVLKTRLPRNYTLYFTEKAEKTTIRSSIIVASDIKDDPQKRLMHIAMPKGLEKFKIETNDPPVTNQLLENQKVLKLIFSSMNLDVRKSASIPLKILNGEVIVEYQTQPNFKPNYQLLVKNPASLEDQLLKILTLTQAFKNINL